MKVVESFLGIFTRSWLSV